MSIAGCHLSASSWSSSAHQLGKGCTMNTLHPACKVTLVRKTSAKCDFSQAMLSIAYKLNCTLQSEMHDVTVRSHAHSAGEYASAVERTAPCYSSERGDLDRLFEMSNDIVSDTPKHVFAQQSAILLLRHLQTIGSSHVLQLLGNPLTFVGAVFSACSR